VNIAKRLFELQEVDLEIASKSGSLAAMKARLGDRAEVARAEDELSAEKDRLSSLERDQRSLEGEIEDASAKIKRTEDEMYSGRTSNPKELSGLEQEAKLLRAKRSELEDRAIQFMEDAESAAAKVNDLSARQERLEKNWQAEQKRLKEDISGLEERLDALREKRAVIAGGIEGDALALYEHLRLAKGTAVSRVDRGICRGCRLSLSSAQMQKVRSGDLIECASCGRILFLA